MKKNLIQFSTGGILILAALGCTEERPYEEVFTLNDQFVEKSELCSGKHEYIYVPSTVEASRTAAATRPHWMGDAKHVKLVCDQSSLKVVEVDVTNDFSDNPTNLKPVLEIPIEHGNFQCVENADGKCTNKEEFSKDVFWEDANHLKFLVDKLEVQEVNFLPIQLTSLFQPSCLKALDTDLVRSEIQENAINITIEKSFKAGLECSGPIRKLSDLGFRVRYHYSIVKLDTVADPNYTPLKYTQADETTFGYFDTQSNKLDVDNNEVAAGDQAFVNRWNPKKSINYHLSDDFWKPQYRAIRKATFDAIEKMNQSLAKIGSQAQINIMAPTEPGQLVTGDIRVNSIVLEDDPLAMNVIGYGPSIANKRTGEILHARTVMYMGTIKKFVKRTYEEFVLKKLAEVQELEQKKKANDNGKKEQTVTLAPNIEFAAEARKFAHQAINEHAHKMAQTPDHGHRHLAGQKFHGPGLPPSKELLRERALSTQANVYSRLNEMQSLEEQQEFLLHKNCFFTADMLAPEKGMNEKIDELISKLGLKLWIQLSEEEKQQALDVLLPFVWTPILVHELGHNLGLRHNFAGSEDIANFYSKEELLDMGVDREISYSSVMDYTYSTLNELPVLGKYDLAALRFGYAEAVELKDGSIIDLASYRENGGELKPYSFCTDEHVALNPNCNRFDEGSNVLEITQHLIKAHKESYPKYNFRNGRKDFSLFDDYTYLRRLQRTLGGMRLVFERYENIKNTFGLTDDSPVWDRFDFLKELKAAVNLGANYLLEVITTADLMCAVSEVKNPFQIVGLVPITALSTNAASCFDSANIQINPDFMVVGRAGKLFQSRKDPRNPNPYIDQIDVRGVWLDKLVAMDILTARTTGVMSFDKFQDNFLDIKDVKEAVKSTLGAVATNQVIAPVEIQTVFGQSFTVDFPVSMYDVNPQQNGHRIIDPISGIGRYFGVPKGNPSFQKATLGILKGNLHSEDQWNNSDSLLNSITSFVLDLGSDSPGQGYVSTRIGSRDFTAPVSSSLAANAISGHELSGLLSQIGQELAQKVLADIEAGKGPSEGASDLEKLAHQLGAPILQAYLMGAIQSQKFYAEVVKAMAN